MRSRPPFGSLLRAFRWHRRWFAALFVAIAVLAALNSVSPADSAGTTVVVASRSIPGGARVTADDLSLVRLPADLVAEGALTDLGQAVGRTVVVGVPARQVFTGSALLGSDGQLAAGQVALPVSFGDVSTVSLLSVGSRIDVLGASASGSGYGVVATNVRVAALPASDEPGALGSTSSRVVLLDVSSAQAVAIVAATAVSAVNFALR
ncbi:MAG: SAF domain-containing protein [Propionicimonas sp.]